MSHRPTLTQERATPWADPEYYSGHCPPSSESPRPVSHTTRLSRGANSAGSPVLKIGNCETRCRLDHHAHIPPSFEPTESSRLRPKKNQTHAGLMVPCPTLCSLLLSPRCSWQSFSDCTTHPTVHSESGNWLPSCRQRQM